MTRRASHERPVEPSIDHIRVFIHFGISRTFTRKLDFVVKYVGQCVSEKRIVSHLNVIVLTKSVNLYMKMFRLDRHLTLKKGFCYI